MLVLRLFAMFYVVVMQLLHCLLEQWKLVYKSRPVLSLRAIKIETVSQYAKDIQTVVYPM